MKQILTAILIFCTFNIFGQSWQPEGTKYPNASNEGDTVSVQTRIPLIDDQGLLNYYLPVGDLLELSPNVTWETITGNQGSVNISGFNNDAGYLNNAMADGRYLQSETDPTVPNNVKNITAGNIDSWNNSLQPGENVSELNNDANYTTITATDERYLRRDIDDNNGVNELTLGGLMLPDLPVGLDTYDQLVVNPTTGEVSKVSVGAFSFDVGNGGGASQFVVDSSTPELNFVGSGDTSVSFNDATNTVTITSTPGAGGGGAVTSFEGRDGAVTSQVGDYNTSEVTENGNLYFTEGRVRGTTLDGLSISNTPITSTNSFIQALGRLQGQINNREVSFSKNTAFNKNFGTSSGTVMQGNSAYTKSESDDKYLLNTTDTFDGVLTVRGAGNSFRNFGAGTGTTNVAYNSFYDSEGNRQGYVGFGSSGDSSLRINNDIGGNTLIVSQIGSEDGLQYYTGSATRTVYHNGNLSLSTLDGVPSNRTITAGSHLSGGGDLSANRTLTLTPATGAWVTDNQGNERIYFGGTSSANGINFKLSGTNQAFRFLNSSNTEIGVLTTDGNLNLANNLNASGLGTFGNTGVTLTGSGNKGILSNNDSGRVLIGGGSTWALAAGAYMTLEGINYGGAGLGGNIILGTGNANKAVNIHGSLLSTGIITAPGGNSNNWNQGYQAYGWGNHASAGYLNTSGGTMTGSIKLNSGNARITNPNGNSILYNNSSETVLSGDNGAIFLRPAGWSSTVGQTVIGTNGSVSVANNLTAGGFITTNGANSLRMNGIGTGDSNVSYVSFYESNGTTRQGYVGFGSGTNSDLIILNDISGKNLSLTDNGRLTYNGDVIATGTITASGSGSFGGRVSGADALNANEFVTRQQVVPLSTQQTGVVRAIEAISSALTVDDGVYMEKGGVQYVLTVPAGTFQQSGRGILDIEGIMEMSNITQDKTLSVFITFSQAGTVYNSDPMSFDLSTTGGGAFGHFKATLTSRMSAGYFFGKGIVTGSDANGSITQGFTINPPTSLDFRQSFTIRMRVNSTSGYSMVLIPFTVKVSDLPN
ncbi:hypothetical protein I215_01918 [Galbibacter marinus]|uniref:Uncharacterized protein n=1 Tax=Galbibacter marinus TaxID=555500 RepID=K2PUA6_9FLAO|nr:hypothetical protein [Galbibacter marinus]EKF56240.1 hypothetical protein I215_01918 [Galbibacter marinus]